MPYKASSEPEPFLIPTRSRQKIAHQLSYPVGAERVSEALANTPQLREIELSFGNGWISPLQQTRYRVVTVRYSNEAGLSPLLSVSRRRLHGAWSLVLFPVRRDAKHIVQTYLVETGLPLIAGWLAERASLQSVGAAFWTLSFDQEQGEFLVETESHLQPARG